MFKISPLRIAVSKARMMIRRSLSLVVVSSFCSSPFSSLLVRGLSAFGKEIIFTGFWGRAMPQSLDATVNTRLKMVSSLLREAGVTSFSLMSLYLAISLGVRWINFKSPKNLIGSEPDTVPPDDLCG